jgi:N-acetylneuraminic acid mutarotase
MGLSIFRRWSRTVIATCLGLVACSTVQAHFIWLAPCADKQEEPRPGQAPTSLEVFFGESPSPDDPELLGMLSGMKLWRVAEGQEPESLEPTKTDESLAVKLAGEDESQAESLYVATHDLGVRDKGGEAFRLVYHAKTGPVANAAAWKTEAASKLIALDVVPSVIDGTVRLAVAFHASPASKAEVKVLDPAAKDVEGETDEDGKFSFPITSAGRYAIRVRHVEQSAGKVADKAYDTVRHYTTVTLDVPETLIPMSVDAAYKLPELPVTLTSFGGAVIGNDVYVYGGTMGSSHDYSKDVQNGSLYHLQVKPDSSDAAWKVISEGPKLQGLALVPHQGKLYRIGGFEARNAKGEEDSLWSSDSVACFDPATSKWTKLPSLPEARSSFDAAVLGDTIYVIGGWAMAGDARRIWHETAWQMDLSHSSPTWQPMAKAPFERRALAVAAHDGKLYAIGGMTSGDETVRETDVYDPVADSWTKGPELEGTEGMTGFGASAFATGGKLYISTVTGSLQRLSDDGQAWQVVGHTPTSRFFHRMLPIDNHRFIVVGGSNMTVGRFKAVEVFEVK